MNLFLRFDGTNQWFQMDWDYLFSDALAVSCDLLVDRQEDKDYLLGMCLMYGKLLSVLLPDEPQTSSHRPVHAKIESC